MNLTARFKDLIIAPQKTGMRQSLLCFRCAKLRVGESDPYLIHFFCCKILLYLFYLYPQEGHVITMMVDSLFSPNPKAVPFFINTDKILVGVEVSQANCVFTFTTSQF